MLFMRNLLEAQAVDSTAQISDAPTALSSHAPGKFLQSTPTEAPRNAGEVLPWKVVHACERARDVLTLVQSQLAVGMRPHLVTPRGFGSATIYLGKPLKEKSSPVSLLQEWNRVRNWRRLLSESDSDKAAEIVHAHSFAAGMAAVRSDATVVYDFHLPIEEIAGEGKSWLGRSFSVAEQFVLSRANAVVVHCEDLWRRCIERGASKENLFLIPHPLDPLWCDSVSDRRWIEWRFAAKPETTVFLVAGLGKKTSESEKQI